MKAKLYDSTRKRVLAEIEIHVPAGLVIWPGKYTTAPDEANYPARFFVLDERLCERDGAGYMVGAYVEPAVVASVGPHLGRLPA